MSFLTIFMRGRSRYYEVTARHLSSCFCRFWHPYSTLTHKQIYRGRSDFILESASCAVALSCGRASLHRTRTQANQLDREKCWI